MSIVIENTAFAADLALYFPKFFHKLFDKNENWRKLLESSVDISRKINIFDEETVNAINWVNISIVN